MRAICISKTDIHRHRFSKFFCFPIYIGIIMRYVIPYAIAINRISRFLFSVFSSKASIIFSPYAISLLKDILPQRRTVDFNPWGLAAGSLYRPYIRHIRALQTVFYQQAEYLRRRTKWCFSTIRPATGAMSAGRSSTCWKPTVSASATTAACIPIPTSWPSRASGAGWSISWWRRTIPGSSPSR